MKTLEGYNLSFAGDASRSHIPALAALSFIDRAENIVPLGRSGVGESHLAIA